MESDAKPQQADTTVSGRSIPTSLQQAKKCIKVKEVQPRARKAAQPDSQNLCIGKSDFLQLNCRRAPHFIARMHSFPFCICIACVLAERLRSTPHTSLSPRARGRPRLAAPPHRSRRAGAPSPR
eukprot:4676628-Pleurochrysis_carterae.AAC.1